jgi:hypothetical protein
MNVITNSVPVSSKKRMADGIDDLDFALESKPTRLVFKRNEIVICLIQTVTVSPTGWTTELVTSKIILF